MIFYDKDGIVIRLAEEQDISKIVELFSKNNFNCDYESGSLRPSNSQLENLINESINSDIKTDAYLVMYKGEKFIGYLAMHIDYDRVVIGHTAVVKKEQHKNYGRMMTFVALNIASNEDRDVVCQCYNPNNYFVKIGFKNIGSGNYLKKTKHVDKKIPKVFISNNEYKRMQLERQKQEIDNFKSFLESDTFKLIKDL